VVGIDGQQKGVMSLQEALALARSAGVDLVEVAAAANPPVCRVVDYGKFRYEQSKKVKESRKHHHANKVKEIQLSAKIDPHDLKVKVDHAVDFLCEEMKVTVSLRFRGREMAHTEFGFDVVRKFIEEIAPFGHPDFEPKLVGRNINLMLSPLPRNKRARNPRQEEHDKLRAAEEEHSPDEEPAEERIATNAAEDPSQKLVNNPFASLEPRPKEGSH
jgi:translation initiation factor IF-3